MKNPTYHEYADGVQDIDLEIPVDDYNADTFTSDIPQEMMDYANDRYSDDGMDDDMMPLEEYY